MEKRFSQDKVDFNTIELSDPFKFESDDEFFRDEEIAERPRFTMEDMKKLIRVFAEMDMDTFRIVQIKIKNPELTMEEVGVLLGITRQAVEKKYRRIVRHKHYKEVNLLLNNFAKEKDAVRALNDLHQLWINQRLGDDND